MTEPIHLAFVWHQHQPFYKLTGSSLYFLPWTRLHAVKDYFDIPALARAYPAIRQTFNLTPSLLIQLQDYVKHSAADRALILTLKPADELTDEEKRYLIDHFFMANERHMIEPYDRYRELAFKPKDPAQWSAQDYRDLQVWFNLAWLGFQAQEDTAAKALFLQGRDYSEDDKKLIIDIHYDVMRRVIPLYAELQQSGQFELTVSPLYHSILPLLCDLAEGGPDAPAWRFPEDAERQIVDGMTVFRRLFDHSPEGMWPSEGAVSLETLSLMAKRGIRWTATDEAIYRHSDKSAGSVTQPHVVETEFGPIALLFRDRQLSDAIGFRYAHIPAEDAVQDFINRVESLRQEIVNRGESPANHLISVILDGENCWETYPDNGRPFLCGLYDALSAHPAIRTDTVSGFLQTQDRSRLPRITRLHAGSWINHSFDTWFGGHAEKKKAWFFLSQARQMLKLESNVTPEIWDELFMAEGSDWFWWYGDDHTALHKHEFDYLFRHHVKRLYELTGHDYPKELDQPIMAGTHERRKILRPERAITPVIDGIVSPHSEWAGAGCYRPDQGQSTMHMANPWIERLFYGRNHDRVFVRLDFTDDQRERLSNNETLKLQLLTPRPIGLEISNTGPQSSGDDSVICAFRDVLEMSFEHRNLATSLMVKVMGIHGEEASFPSTSPIIIT
jgi:alpha-amylase/alpha-mannosidase (GH57 family)